MLRCHLNEEGEWLLQKLDVDVQRAHDGSVSMQDLRRIQRRAAEG